MQNPFPKKRITHAVLLALTSSLAACGGDDTDTDEARRVAREEAQQVAQETAQQVAESTAEQVIQAALAEVPSGLGYEHYVAVPRVVFPLPATSFVPNNNGNGRFYLDSNPINYALRGINSIWKGTTDNWQQTAGDYTDETNGYKAGDGPNPHNAVNGRPSDYVEAGTEIVDAETWQANIQYVIDVTASRSDEQALFAFLDDVRSKNYSTIDGFGPLTEDYANHSGAYASFEDILLSDVTENHRYKPDDNDSFSTYGGQEDALLGDMVKLAKRFRNSSASTSGPKYLYGTPRPWRMNASGAIEFQGVDTLECVDGASPTREIKEYRIDNYISSVSVIPGLYCGRRAHSSSHEADGLYSTTTENRRKDNGYPSGHTNAGYLASLAYAYMLPERYVEHLVRGSDLGENRILAGMHSPVDVISGRIQAQMVAAYALSSQPQEAQTAYQQARDYFGPKAAEQGMSLYEYAHREVANEGSFANPDNTLNVNVFNNNRYSDHNAIKETYTFRITYGLPQTGDKNLPAVIPENAELLLETRLPYLSDAQRRAVLATTSIESGYPLLDASNGWGRLNLVAAADGYGAFEGDVHVTMLRSEGGFSAHDWWRNDISGEGMLSKAGTGQLTLTGANSYSGGTLVKGGILEARSTSAFGSGDLYIASGEVEVSASGALVIAGNLTQKSGGLTVSLDTDATQIMVSGTATVNQGLLTLDAANHALAAGETYTILSASGGLTGKFDEVTLLNSTLSAAVSYTANDIVVSLSES